MIKHTFKLLLVVVALVYVPFVKAQEDDRIVWIGAMTRIADPVLINLSQNTLKRICLMSLYRRQEVSFRIWKLSDV